LGRGLVGEKKKQGGDVRHPHRPKERKKGWGWGGVGKGCKYLGGMDNWGGGDETGKIRNEGD